MTTPSTLLLCAGTAASLAGVWVSAGLSERSALRLTGRVVVGAALGLIGQAVVFGRAPAEVRGELSLALLFAGASVLALAVGAAKLEAALFDKDGPRVLRRAAGIVAGTALGMLAVGVVSLELSSGSLALARLAWALMFSLVGATVVTFAQRARYAGAGLQLLGARALPLGLFAVGLLIGARLTAVKTPTRVAVSASSPAAAIPVPPAVSPAVSPAVPTPSVVAPATADSSPPLAAAPVAAPPGSLQIEALQVHAMLEADVRGGLSRRMQHLQACLADPPGAAKGALSLKVWVDASGSVSSTRVTGGELAGTPLATCLLPVFYKIGFAAPASSSAHFEITLRVP